MGNAVGPHNKHLVQRPVVGTAPSKPARAVEVRPTCKMDSAALRAMIEPSPSVTAPMPAQRPGSAPRLAHTKPRAQTNPLLPLPAPDRDSSPSMPAAEAIPEPRLAQGSQQIVIVEPEPVAAPTPVAAVARPRIPTASIEAHPPTISPEVTSQGASMKLIVAVTLGTVAVAAGVLAFLALA